MKKTLLLLLLLLLLFSCSKETIPEVDPCEGLTSEIQVWEKGVIPYYVPPSIDIGGGWMTESFNERDRKFIDETLAELSNQTGLIFIKYENRIELLNNHNNGIEVTPSMINNSQDIGMSGGIQRVTFTPESSFTPEKDLTKRSIKHEFLHAVGFNHMVEHLDRDNHIVVHWDNIVRGEMVEEQFVKREVLNYHDCIMPFDIHSIMMYGSDQGVKDKSNWQENPSITTLDGELIKKPQDLSQGDVLAVEIMYESEFTKR